MRIYIIILFYFLLKSNISTRGAGLLTPAKVLYRSLKPGQIALTFELGPSTANENEEKEKEDEEEGEQIILSILSTLKSCNLPATFFIDSFRIFKQESLVRKILEAGHFVGALLQYNNIVGSPTVSIIQQDLGDIENAFVNVIGERSFLLRISDSIVSKSCKDFLGIKGYVLFDSWKDIKDHQYKNSNTLLSAVKKSITSKSVTGGVIRFRERSWTSKSLLDIIQHIWNVGFDIVPLSQVIPSDSKRELFDHYRCLEPEPLLDLMCTQLDIRFEWKTMWSPINPSSSKQIYEDELNAKNKEAHKRADAHFQILREQLARLKEDAHNKWVEMGNVLTKRQIEFSREIEDAKKVALSIQNEGENNLKLFFKSSLQELVNNFSDKIEKKEDNWQRLESKLEEQHNIIQHQERKLSHQQNNIIMLQQSVKMNRIVAVVLVGIAFISTMLRFASLFRKDGKLD